MALARSACLPHLAFPEPSFLESTQISLVLHEALVCAVLCQQMKKCEEQHHLRPLPPL